MNNNELNEEIKKSKAQGNLTKRAIAIFQEMIEKVSEQCKVSNPKECKEAAMKSISLHWEKLKETDDHTVTKLYCFQILKAGYISKMMKWD